MSIRPDSNVLYSLQKLAERRIARRIGAQHEHVHKETD